MELNSEIVTTPPRDAATVVLLRDAPAGLEVLLLKRHAAADVLGGAYVFPGGKIDATDAALSGRLDQPVATLHAALGEPDRSPAHAVGCYVAALREAFEESGVLFAHGATPAQLEAASALLRAGKGFAELLQQLDLRLDTQRMQPWSRWITPRMPSVSNKRFDTRFFVAAAPADQVARHDEFETTASLWIAPRAALSDYWEGRIELAPPQIMSLGHLARHPDVASVLAEARRRPPPLIQPEPFDQDGMRVLTYPGDPHHSARERALPGPTRLMHRNRRFEPEGGLQALWD